jgi:hypothetical protein
MLTRPQSRDSKQVIEPHQSLDPDSLEFRSRMLTRSQSRDSKPVIEPRQLLDSIRPEVVVKVNRFSPQVIDI